MTRHLEKLGLAALVQLLVVAGCSGSGEPGPRPTTSAFDGTWADCSFDGVKDVREVFTIGEGRFTGQGFTYETADGTCNGIGTTDGPIAISFTVGGEIPATLGSSTVTATAVDMVVTSPPEALYTIFWRGAAGNPDVLYSGDTAAAAGLDGTASEKRPNVLEDGRPRYLQTTPIASDLTGTWLGCSNNGFDTRTEMTISIAGSTVTEEGSGTMYSSTDGSCGGNVVGWSSYSSFATIGTPIYATLGGMTVTALSIDGSADVSYTVAWVDKRVTPNELHFGELTAIYDGSSAAARPTVLEQSAYARQ